MDRFDDPYLTGVLNTKARVMPVSCGTELTVMPSDAPEAIPVEQCQLGWQESLEQRDI